MKQLSLFPAQTTESCQSVRKDTPTVRVHTQRNQKVTWELTKEEAAYFIEMVEIPLYKVMEGGKYE